MNSNKKIISFVLILLLVSGIWMTVSKNAIFSNKISSADDSRLLSDDFVSGRGDDSGNAKLSNRLFRDRERLVTSIENPEIQTVINFLVDLEKNRSKLTNHKRSTSLNQSVFIFELNPLPSEKILEVMEKINSLKTFRKNEDGKLERWSEYLRKSFFVDYLTNEISVVVIFAEESSAIHTYAQVIDPLTGEIKELPGKVTLAQLVVNNNNNWRFSHLIDFDPSQDE